MKKKTRFIIIAAVIAVVVIFIAAINISVYLDFKNVISTQFEPNECDIDVKNYTSGQNIDIEDVSIKEEILKSISEIKYDGLSGGVNGVSTDDYAYSIIISSKHSYVILTVAENPDKSCIIGNKFNIAIKNYDSLYKTVESLFD